MPLKDILGHVDYNVTHRAEVATAPTNQVNKNIHMQLNESATFQRYINKNNRLKCLQAAKDLTSPAHRSLWIWFSLWHMKVIALAQETSGGLHLIPQTDDTCKTNE